ncbi:MAG TPA: VCBS repeat-containing protein, partial [Planctomycetota bacterium]|nr:VCBS repeat-containing protein [Planctomycetota bacterium]
MTEETRGSEELQEEELALESDEIIGKAFRWSLLVLVSVAAVVALIVWAISPREAPVIVEEAPTSLPRFQERPVEPPELPFRDITEEAGITFVHENGARGRKLLPETMGGGCAFLDYDGDGDQDLLFVNSTTWPGDAPDPARSRTLALYRNDGSGRFEDVTSDAGLAAAFFGMGVAIGDVDGDGLSDLFFTAVGRNRLFRNLGGKFEDVTDAAGVAGGDGVWSTSAAFADFDRDGDLDLFVCNYIAWSREIDEKVNYRLTGIGRAYGPPTDFDGDQSYFYR